MKGRQIVLDGVAGRKAAALMVDGALDDLLIETDAPAPGTIYRAVVDRQVKGQGGVFLRTPDGGAWLRDVKGLAPGDAITVQVAGYSEPGKAIPVTGRLLFKSRYAIVTPDAPGLNISRRIRDEAERDRLLEIAHDMLGEGGFGLILRSSCAGADADEIAQDIADMAAIAAQVTQDSGRTPEVLLLVANLEDPGRLADLIASNLELTVDDFMAQRQGTLLSVGFVLLLFYASGSVNAILKGFGESVHVRDRPHPMVFRLVSIGLLVLLTLMFLTAVLLLGVAGEVLDWAHSPR